MSRRSCEPFSVFLATLCAMAVWGGAASSHGAERDASEGQRKLVVFIASRQDESQSSMVVAAMRSQLVDLEVDMRTVWVDDIGDELGDQLRLAKDFTPQPATLVAIWFELRPADTSLLYLLLPQSDRLLVRGFSPAGIGPLSEAMSVVVRGSVASLLTSGDEAGTDLSAAGLDVVSPSLPEARSGVLGETLFLPGDSSLLPRPSASVDSEPGQKEFRASFFAAYRPELYTSRIWSHGLDLGANYRFSGPFSIGFGYDLVLSDATYLSPELRLSLKRHPLWLALKGSLDVGRWWIFALELAGILDFVSRTLAVSDEIDLFKGSRLATDCWLSLGLEADVRITDEIAVLFGVGAQVGLRRASYEATSPEGKRELLVPLIFRPQGKVGIRINIW